MIVDAIFVGLIFYLTFPLLTGYCAFHYGRPFGVWFGIGCLLPVVSFIVLFFIISWDEKTTPKNKLSRRERAESEEIVKDLMDNLKEPQVTSRRKTSKQRS